MLIEQTNHSDLQGIIDCLKADLPNCLYLYIDLTVYGMDNPNMKVWTGIQAGKIDLVIMKYHDSFQIYKKSDIWDQEQDEILDLVQKFSPERISGNEPSVRHLETALSDTYQAVYGAILRGNQNLPGNPPEKRRCEWAEISDIREIVELMMDETDFGKTYQNQELMAQLEERYRTGMGRSMIIRDKDRIVGHIATFAEAADLAIVGGSVMRKEYRKTDLYDVLCKEFYSLLLKEERKDIYFFLTNKRHIALYSRLFQKETTYGKLIKK